MLDPSLEWLGFRPRPPVAGVHVTSRCLTLVALRRWPLRLVAVARRPIPGAAVVDNDIRLIEPLVDTLRLLVERTRLAPDTPAIAVVEPLADRISIAVNGSGVSTAGNGSGDATCDVSARSVDRVTEVVARTGLTLSGIDIVPAALARLASLGRKDGDDRVESGRRRAPVQTRSAGRPQGPLGPGVAATSIRLESSPGWSAVVAGGRLEANRMRGEPGRAVLRLGFGPELTGVVGELAGLEIPPGLRPLVDLGFDAVAIGGAMAGFGSGPRVMARPVAVPAGSGWTVQPVPVPGDRSIAEPDREPIVDPGTQTR